MKKRINFNIYKISVFVSLFFFCAHPACSQSDEYDQIIRDALDKIENLDTEIAPKPQVKAPVQTSSGLQTEEPIIISSDGAKQMVDVVDVKDLDVVEALKIIAQKGGVDISVARDVKGLVTAQLKYIDPLEALRVIVQPMGLAFLEEGEKIHVMTQARFEEKYGFSFGDELQVEWITLQFKTPKEMFESLNTMKSPEGRVYMDEKNNKIILVDLPEVIEKQKEFIARADVAVIEQKFSLKFIKVADIQAAVRDQLSKDVGRLVMDEQKNNLTVTDTASKLAQIAEFVKKIDVKEEKEFILNIKTIQILLNDEHEAGVDWEAIVSDYQNVELPMGLMKKEDLKIGTVSAEDYKVLLDALDTVGIIYNVKEETLTVPQAQAENMLIFSREIPQDARNRPLDARTQIFKEVQFVLSMQPSSQERLIDTHLKIYEVFEEPVDAQTHIEVESGFTLILGGLFKKVKVNHVRKIPLLGDLPLVGFAFRNEGRRSVRTEIISFMTVDMKSKVVSSAPLAGELKEDSSISIVPEGETHE